MTLKYESEILFDLMKRDGDDAPSDVLPYESELKEKYINQVLGAYPKLQDYRSEWLNYNLCQGLPSDFPTESVINVTSASFHNVVPYEYKSAILTGQTLINLSPIRNKILSRLDGYSPSIALPINMFKSDVYYIAFMDIGYVESATSTLHFQWKDNNRQKFNVITDNASTVANTKVAFKFKQTLENPVSLSLTINSTNPTDCKVEINNFMVIEYQEGIENWDIPYFEGMQSVKMPVLTTTGKNLFGGSLIATNDLRRFELKGLKLVEGEKYALSYNYSKDDTKTHQLQYMTNSAVNPTYLSAATTNTSEHKIYFTAPKDLARLFIYTNDLNSALEHFSNIQIEQGTQATTYEPYKTNILTVNEEVTLRGIGDVKDTLDLLTGESTQRVGEIMLDGSEEWGEITLTNKDDYLSFGTILPIKGKPTTYLGIGVIDSHGFSKLILDYADNGNSVGEAIIVHNNGRVYIRLLKSRLTTSDVVGWKQYLQSNPVTVQYQLATESIKTVELSCVNEQGDNEKFRPIEGTMHVNTSSQALPPLLDMSVPVEATTQNLMSFANIEVEE